MPLAAGGAAAPIGPAAVGSAPPGCGAAADSLGGGPSRDLYCMDLVPAPAVPGASGTVELRRVPGPFAVGVAPDGRIRYDVVATLAGLPDPATLGDYSTYVAWVAGPTLTPFRRLGEVGNGTHRLGRVELAKFLVLVSAEPSSAVEERSGPFVLRGQSPSSRKRPPDLLEFLVGAAPGGDTADGGGHGAGDHAGHGGDEGWVAPPMPEGVAMLPAMMRLRPDAEPYLPAPTGAVPEARPRELRELADGDTLALEAGFVMRTVGNRRFTMLGFNGQYPGPLIDVPQDATVFVRFTNRIDRPTTVHWHGVRLDNRFDGVPWVTQEPVAPGETFLYRIHFRDAGIYWYHPHHREDIQQDLGLYGNMLVRSPRPDYFGPAHREEVLMLDDLLVGGAGLVPYGRDGATHALMGRFGNVLLVNGEPGWRLGVDRGEVVRFFLTNVANTRTFNLSFGGAPMKVVGTDVGNFQREEWVESVVIAPAERYVVHVRFPEAGEWPLLNRVQGVDHLYGRFFPETDTLGTVRAGEASAEPDLAADFRALREHEWVTEEVEAYRGHFERPVDRELVLEMRTRELPFVSERIMQLDSAYFSPVEWSGTMPFMNWSSTTAQVEWVLRDPATGRENMAIDWRFRTGDVVKVRIRNERRVLHGMQHPIHIHGQRFLVLSQDGVPNDNLAWKDTMLLPVGSTADLLLELSNPGRWMLHCHIAEHLEAGMRMVFVVEEDSTPR